MFKKIIPYILTLALVIPSNLGQILPVFAADNGGESVFLAESLETEEGIETQTEDSLEEETEEGLEEGVYAVPLNSYYVLKTTTTAGNMISPVMPAWNERAMVTVASGGAISMTFQIYNSTPYDYFQVMKWEESEKLTFGLASPDKEGNKTLAAIKMGTFNVAEEYLAANTSMANTWFTEENDSLYDDTVQVSKDSDTGYTYLTMNLDSIDRLYEKLVVKVAFNGYTSLPVNTNFFVFEPENMVKMPDISEYEDGGTKWVQLSDIRGNVPTNKGSNLTDGTTLLNVENLFSAVETEVSGDSKLTISGELNAESFEGIYGVSCIRELSEKSLPSSKTDTDILYYYHPYYKAKFENLDISDYEFELTFDLTMENLVFGVPISIKTKEGTGTDFSQYTDEELDKLASSYCMLHVLPEEASTVVKYDEDGVIRLTADSYTVREEDVFAVDKDSEEVKALDLYQALEPAAAVDDDGNPYFEACYYEIQTASGSAIHLTKNVEIAFQIPEGWGENEVYVANRITKESGGVLTYYYEPSELQIEDGYIIFNTNYSSGEFYLYLQDIPSDLNLLSDGLYNVKITAMHSSQDGRMSMADSALVKEALLQITTDSNGNKTKELYMDFQVMYIGDTPGYLSNVGTSSSYGTDGESAIITWGEILDYFTEDGSDELLVDEWHKENFDYNVYLVKTAKITLQEYTGDSDSLYDNYYPVYFEVPPMDTDPTDGIDAQVVRLMVNHCVKVTDESVTLPVYQKSVLKKAIADGNAINGEVYTTESYNALKAALVTGQAAYESNPGAEIIKSNAEAINAAIAALVVDESKMADKSVLETKLSEAKAIAGDNYTASSYLKLQEAIEAAEKIYEDDTATEEEVEEQILYLEATISALILIDLGAIAPSDLPDGTYTIPIRLWHAIKDQASMGDGALNSTGILTVKEGSASLQIELEPLVFAGLTGYLMQFDTLSDYTIGTSGYPENYTKNPATVLETYDYVDQYNSEDSTDEICKGQKYPKTISINVALPQVTGVNYTWVHVYVPVMGELDSGDQEARLRLDYTAIAKQGEPTLSLDHTALTLSPGGTKVLTATLTDSEETIVWTTDNDSVATVDSNGLVTALSVGTATITATAGNVSSSCIVTVAEETTEGGDDTDTGNGTGDGSTGTGDTGSGGSTTDDSDESLEDGTYSISVKLWHASKDQVSMGNGALVQTAKLVIKDGDGTLYITFQGMTYAGQKGYLAELEPSTVISTYNVVDQFNSEDSTDDRVRGKKYPKKLAVPVTPGEEYTKVTVYVPVMGSLGVGEQDARLKLNYSAARYISSSTKNESAASDEDLYFDEGEAVEGNGNESAPETKVMVTEAGKKYFYENDVKLTSQFITFWGKGYYVGEDGAAVTSQFVTWEGNTYYAGETGAVKTYEMIKDKGKTYYAGKGGIIVTSSLFLYKSNYYYANELGVIETSALITYEGDKYYAGKDGAIVKSMLVTYNGKKYYAYKTGIIATSAMITYNDKKYYAYKTGRIATSAMITYNGKKYYAYKTGRIATSTIITYNDKKYYAYKTGRIAASDLITYKKNQYYTGKDGVVVSSKWVNIKGERYYFDKYGRLVKSA